MSFARARNGCSVSIEAVGSVGLSRGLPGDGLLQGLENIALEILCVLYAAANADEVIEHAHGLTLVLGNTGVGHAARHLNKRFDTTERLGEGEDGGELAEALGSTVAALDAEREHAATHTVAMLALGDGPVRVGVKARVVDSNNVGGSLERMGYGGSVT